VTPRSQPGLWTGQQIRALGAVTDLPTAAAIFGLSRTVAYELARTGGFPVPVIRAGTRYRVPVAAILHTLRLDTTGHTAAGVGLDPAGGPSLDHHTESDTRCPGCGQPLPARGRDEHEET
jgi:hypothetical protein